MIYGAVLRVSAAVCCLFVFDETTATALCEPPHPTLEIEMKDSYLLILAGLIFGAPHLPENYGRAVSAVFTILGLVILLLGQ